MKQYLTTEKIQAQKPPARPLNRNADVRSALSAALPGAAPAAHPTQAHPIQAHPIQAHLIQARFGHDFRRLALTADAAATLQRQADDAALQCKTASAQEAASREQASSALSVDSVIQRNPNDSDSDSETDNSDSEESSQDSGDSSEESEDSSEDSGDDSDDGDFIVQTPSSSKGKANPDSLMKGGAQKGVTASKKGKINAISYQTTGGQQHNESYNPTTLFSRAVTTNSAKNSQTGMRNNASKVSETSLTSPTRPYSIHNHIGLSKGQHTLNLPVSAHRTPSEMGMRAGGAYGNTDMTSNYYNGKPVKNQEQKLAQNISPGIKATWTTDTEYEDMVKNKRIAEIVKHPDNRWTEKRIKKRLDRFPKVNPKATTRIKSQRKSAEFIEQGKKRKLTGADTGPDLFYALPARQHSEEAQKKYKAANDGYSSEESDSELYAQKPPKKKRKVITTKKTGS